MKNKLIIEIIYSVFVILLGNVAAEYIPHTINGGEILFFFYPTICSTKDCMVSSFFSGKDPLLCKLSQSIVVDSLMPR